MLKSLLLLFVGVLTVSLYVVAAPNDFLFDEDNALSLKKRDVDITESSGEKEADQLAKVDEQISLPIDKSDNYESSVENVTDDKLSNDTVILKPPTLDDVDDELDKADLLFEAGSGIEPPNPNRARFFRITIKVTSETCVPGLQQRESAIFQDFERRWTRAVLDTIGDLPGRQMINIIQIECGSVVTKFDLGSQGFDDGAYINTRLMDAVRKGVLGEFEVSPIDYEFIDLSDVGGGGPAPVAPQPRNCRSDEFTCRSLECIRDYERCDGVQDCRDGSDEVGCRRCDPNNEIDCGRGVCVPASRRCDGRRDCPDNRDEERCPVGCDERSELDCGRGICIPLSSRCDGRRDCPDNRDEIGCGCDPNNEIDCGRGRCVSLDKRCDGVRDCNDNRDEDNCEFSVRVEVREPRVTVDEGSQARFRCIASCPPSIRDCTVRWGFNTQSNPLPAGVTLLTPTVIQFSPAVPGHSGRYYCWVDGFPQTTAFGELTVNPVFVGCNEYTCENGRCVSRDSLCNGNDDCGDNSDERACSSRQCDPTEMRCNNGRHVQKIWACDGDDDCKDGTDEQIQFCPAPVPGSSCTRSEHECNSRDQCVPRSYLCDGQVDCLDRSDEVGCAPPTVTRPPVRTLSVRLGGTIVLTCTAIGKPTPLINWRLNWGCIPSGSRVSVTSVNGMGTLTIRDARRTDAGAYTCEAINNQQSIFGNPDAIVSVIGVVPPPPRTTPTPTQPPFISCPRGLFNDQARRHDDCIDCWCSGLSNVCRSSQLGWNEFSDHDGIVLADKQGSPLSSSLYRYDPRYRRYTVPDYRLAPRGDLFWKLPASFRGKMLVTYGGWLRYTIEYETRGLGQPSRSYDVLIRGRERTAYCRVSNNFQPGRPQSVSFLVTEKSCVTDSRSSSSDLVIPVAVTRPMFMEILVDVQDMLIRATYAREQSSVSISDISIQKGEPSGRGGQAVTVEHCDGCPLGYTGMSCEECAAGFERRSLRGECLQIQKPDPQCNAAGTEQEVNGRCYCKPFATGARCDECKAQTYELGSSVREGCTECFCMGVTADCTGSRLRRETIAVTSASAANWALVDAGNNVVGQNVLSSNGREIVADLRSLGSGSYYWRLPIEFVGNKLGAYGGTLRFNTKFIAPSVDQPNNASDVIMFGAEGIQLTAKFENIRLDTREHNAQVKMVVDRWSRVDGAPSSREHFLMALTGIRDILVKASFTRDTREARISDVTLDVASERGTGSRALEVEQCNCPPQYSGLSCENCRPGYTRAAGVYLGICTRCDCNGHSDECDDNSGYCLNCKHGTTGRYCERCAPGFERNANDDSPYECIRPTTLVTIPEPDISVSVGGRVVLECRAYAPDLPTSSIVWRRVDGLALPRTSSQPQAGQLVIENVQRRHAGEYRCTITTVGGIVGNGIVSLVVITAPCPTGYANPPSCNTCDRGYSLDRNGRCTRGGGLIVVRVRPSSLTINEGEDIRLTCTARSQVDNSVYLVVWQREGGRLARRATTYNGELIIRDAEVSDSGVYSCTGSSPVDTHTERVTVSVRRVQPPTQLTVSVEPANLYLTEGSSGVIRCVVTGNARLVEWRHGSGRSLPSKHEVSRTRIEGDTLRIVRMDASDRGYYYCTALGADAVTRVESRPPALVDFQQGGPGAIRSFVTIITPDVRVYEGQTARLECRVDNSVSVASIQWSRRDRARMGIRYRQSNGVLTLRSAEPRDSGTFICTVRTTDGREQRESARLTVDERIRPREPVRVEIVGGEAGNLQYKEGDRIDLRCRLTSGSPSSAMSWQFGGGSWPSNVQRAGSQIYVPSAIKANTGMYTCVGDDGYSTDQQQIYITVSQGPIVIDIPDRFEVELGRDVTMDCKVPEHERSNSRQIMAYWRNDRGQRLTPPTLQLSELNIVSVDFTHAGNYTCVLEAEGFSTSKLVMLVVVPQRNGLIFWRQNPISVSRLIGQSATFDCKPTTLLPTTTEWKRENSVNLPSGAFQSGSKLQFRNLRYSDAGTYTCTARNSLGSAQLHVTLVVEGPPGVPVISVNNERLSSNGVKTCKAGETITINCLAEGSPAPKYVWSRMLSQGGFQYITSSGDLQVDDGSLRIYRIKKVDEGYYNCSAQNAFGSKETYAKIVVELDSVVPTNVVVRGSGSGSRRDMYTAGRTAVLRCDAASQTPVTYSWSFSGGAMPANARVTNAVLQLINLRRSNQGTYSCVVRNDAGDSQPASAQVFVSGGVGPDRSQRPSTPTPERSDYSSPVRGTIRMRCPLPANADRITWTRARRLALPVTANVYDRGQLLEITNVRAEDGGVYYCSAVNTAGGSPAASITVLISERLPEKPNSSSSPTDIFAYPGSDVYMSCKTTDSSLIDWSRRDGQLPASATLDSGPGWARLVISNIKSEDAGVYMCQATNQYGSSEPLLHTLEVGNAREAVLPPVISGDSVVVYGQTAELKCSPAQAQAARYTWTRQDGQLPRDSRISGGVLTINNFRPEDAGVYTCTSAVSAGTSSASFRLSGRTASVPLAVTITPRGTLSSPSQQDNYVEGTRLDLLCEPSNPNAQVVWSRPDNNLPAHASQNGNTLVFERLEEIDADYYRCTANYGGSEVYESYGFRVTASVRGNPITKVSIDVQPANLLEQGSTVQLTCLADGDSVYYEWKRTSGQLSDRANAKDDVLTIREFESSDEGEYVCSASNNFGLARSARSRLILRG